jgi:hypothetical protein
LKIDRVVQPQMLAFGSALVWIGILEAIWSISLDHAILREKSEMVQGKSVCKVVEDCNMDVRKSVGKSIRGFEAESREERRRLPDPRLLVKIACDFALLLNV